MAHATSFVDDEAEKDTEVEDDFDDHDDHDGHDSPALRAADEAKPESADLHAEGAAEKGRREDPTNFLALYFRDMARLDVLKPQAEFAWAERIEGLEIAVWAELLNYRPLLHHTLRLIEKTLGKLPRKLAALSRVHSRASSPQSQARFRKRGLEAGAVLRIDDSDRHVLDAVLADRKLLQAGKVERLLINNSGFSPTTKGFSEHLQAVDRAYAAAQRAKNEFIKANLRLVVAIARRFNYGKMSLSDLIQEGNIGLIKAVDRYDFRRGYRFSTYASWWIRHAISRGLADKGREVRLPVHMLDAYYRVGKAQRKLLTTLGREPSNEEIAGATGLTAGKVEHMRTFILDQAVSLDRQVGEDDDRRFVDLLRDNEPDQSDGLIESNLEDEVREQLLQLRPLEAEILKKRFGLETDQERTLKEIGDEYQLSRERIRQLQEQALGKIRRAFKRKDIL